MTTTLRPRQAQLQQQQQQQQQEQQTKPADSTRVVAVSGQWIELQCPLASELLALATTTTTERSSADAHRQQQQHQQQQTNSYDRPNNDHHSIVWRKDDTKLDLMNPRLRVSQQNGSLIIVNAQARLDEANYECSLVNELRPDQPIKSHRFELTLLLAPRLAPFEFPRDSQIGMKMLVTCSALEGQQPISFVWLKDGQVINPAGPFADGAASGAARQQQQPHPLQHQHQGTHQQQQQQPAQVSLSQLHQQQLADKLAVSPASSPSLGGARSPGYVILLGGGGAASGPDSAELPGEDSSAAAGADSAQQPQMYPPIRGLLSDAAFRIKQADDYSILSIDRLELKHTGRYTCSAQNEAARVAHSSQLNINAPPTLSVEPRDQDDLVSGQRVVIDCAAAGQPRPQISWARARESSGKQWDFVPIYDNLRYTLLQNGSLAIANVSQREQGHYLCSAKNGFGPEASKLIQITVHEPARFGSKYKTVESRIDERVQLQCTASGEPPISIEWLDKDGNSISKRSHTDKRLIVDDQPPPTDALDDGFDSPANRTAQQSPAQAGANPSGSSSKLIITNLIRSDTGHYSCIASNRFGTDKLVTSLLVQDVPERVLDLKVTNVTSSTVSLRWQIGSTGNAPITSYLVQYQSDDPLDDLLINDSTRAAIAAAATAAAAATGVGGAENGSPSPTNGTGPSPAAAAAAAAAADGGPTASLAQVFEALANQQQQQTSTLSPLRAALEALNSLASGLDAQNTAASLASTSADEAIDRTLVELTVEQSGTSLVVKDLTPYCVYRMRLAAINKIGLGEFTDWIRAKTEEAPPGGSALRISAAATGPNSIKLTWLPPDRRSWNGQINRFNIGYRPIDSPFELNKTVEWQQPSLSQSMQLMIDSDSKRAGSSSPSVRKPGASSRPNSGKAAPKQQQGSADDPSTTSSPSNNDAFMLRQHLRQLLALQQQELVAHLTNLQRSTTYLIWIQAANGRGEGPRSHVISVKTLDDVPPSAPSLRVQASTTSSITITWSMLSNFVSPANQYTLFYRRLPPVLPGPSSGFFNTSSAAKQSQPIGSQSNPSLPPIPPPISSSAQSSPFFGDQQASASQNSNPNQNQNLITEPGPFIERTIDSQQLLMSSSSSSIGNVPDNDQSSMVFASNNGPHYLNSMQNDLQNQYQNFVYTLDQLDCGSVYELYMTTRNSVGKSEPSPVVTTRTLGEPPLAPSNKHQLFSRIGTTEVQLNLSAWMTGGCPLSHIAMRYKPTPQPQASASATGSASASLQQQQGTNQQVQSKASLSGQTNSSSTSSAMNNGWIISTSAPPNVLASINNNQPASSSRHLTDNISHQQALIGLMSSDANQLIGSSGDASTPSFSLRNLSPNTGYELEIVAYNAAGRTIAQYEFVTANTDGTRSGYTRRDGNILRVDQRGTNVLSNPNDGNRQLGLDSATTPGSSTAAGTISSHLVPLALTIVCLVCLTISSTFCYYRLAELWNQHLRGGCRRDSSDATSSQTTTGANGTDRCSVNGRQSFIGSPGESIARAALWRLNGHDADRHLGHVHVGGLGVGNGSGHGIDDQAPDSPSTTVQYCVRDPASGQHLLSATLNPKYTTNMSQFSQSLSMKDFNLENNVATLNLKRHQHHHRQTANTINPRQLKWVNYRQNNSNMVDMGNNSNAQFTLNTSSAERRDQTANESTMNILCSTGQMRATHSQHQSFDVSTDCGNEAPCDNGSAYGSCTQRAKDVMNGSKTQQVDEVANATLYGPASAASATYVDQHLQESSLLTNHNHLNNEVLTNGWKSSNNSAIGLSRFADGSPNNVSNYAIPAVANTLSTFQQNNISNSNHDGSTADPNIIYNTYGPNGIDACIRQLISHNERQQNVQDRSFDRRQYALLINQANRNPTAGDTDPNYDVNATDCPAPSTIQSNYPIPTNLSTMGGQSLIESTSSSSGVESGISGGGRNTSCPDTSRSDATVNKDTDCYSNNLNYSNRSRPTGFIDPNPNNDHAGQLFPVLQAESCSSRENDAEQFAGHAL